MITTVKCPNCSTAAQAFMTHLGDHTVYGAATQHFFSCCTNCGGEFEAVNFADSEGNWNLHKYRPAMGENEWTVVEEMPEDQMPLVIVGPGGEYYKAVRICESRLERFFKRALTSVKKAINHEGHEAHEGCECKKVFVGVDLAMAGGDFAVEAKMIDGVVVDFEVKNCEGRNV